MKNFGLLFIIISLFNSCQNESAKVNPKAKKEQNIVKDTKLIWHWEDNFTDSEKEKIKKYITKVSEATFTILGNYPFDVHYYFHRSNSQNEPIPWAHTERQKNRQGVRFYINPELGEDILFNDWTAPHEISHLAIPFLGKENSWFAEGFASYMQYQIMQELGIYSKDEVNERYAKRIAKIRSDYTDNIPFVENAKALRAKYNFPAMYWGGAMYFIYLNGILIEQERTTVNEIIRKYQTYRGKDKNIEMLLRSLERELNTKLFTDLYNQCKVKSFNKIFEEKLL